MSKKNNNNNLNKQKVRKCQKKWKGIKIDKELRDIIHGYIASDGFVREDGTMTIDNSEKQEKFVQWLYQKLKNLRTESPIKTVPRKDKRTGKTTISKRFNTRSLLKGFHKMWYRCHPDARSTSGIINAEGKKEYKKCLPKKMEGFFSSTFLAVWFAGDGTKMDDSRGAKYEVTSFTVDERRELQRLFKKKFDIDAVINRSGVSSNGKEQWALCINAPDYNKFRALITKIDLIPTIFPYKLHKSDSRRF